MSWPTMSDYQEAIQNPTNCFSDATLKSGTAALNALGLPQPITGGFCSVYKVTSGKTRWAVRCFLHDIQDLRDRYKQISGYLKRNRPKHMVGFEYVLDGIRVRQEWHPVLKMEWVDGDTLDVWIEKHLPDPKALRKLAERWAEMLKALERAHIGHCDLQHGNILVDGTDNLRLIDYDGMYVPPLRGRGSHERGHPAYQHPQREGKDFDENVDRFCALAIQTSLLALAESRELWARFYVGDNLIFRRSDFQSPDNSPVFDALEKLGGTVADHSEALREACKERLDKTPRLHEVKARNPGASPSPKPEAANPIVLAKSNGNAGAIPKMATAPVAAKSNGNGGKKRSLFSFPKPTPAAAAGGGKAAKPAPAARQPASATATRKPAAQPLWMGGASVGSGAVPDAPVTSPAAARPAPPAAPVLAAALSQTGWAVEWMRPGQIDEQHVWQLPVHGTRDSPRRFLGLSLGTRREKFVESYEEKVEELNSHVGGHRSAITSLAFTSDGRLLASGSSDGSLRVWNVQSGREACAPLELRSSVVTMALSPDRPMIAAVLKDGRLVLWDFGPRRRVIHLRAPDGSPLRAVTVSNDGRWVAAGGRRCIYTWQTDRGTAGGEMKHTTGRIDTLAFTLDASAVVCGTSKGRLELFERGSDAARWSIRTGLGRIVSLTVPPRGNGVVGGAVDGTVASWGIADGSVIQRVRPMLGRLTSLAVTPDASLILVGLRSGQACLSEAGTGRELALLDGHPGPVTASALPGTGKCAATGATDGTVRLWLVR